MLQIARENQGSESVVANFIHAQVEDLKVWEFFVLGYNHCTILVNIVGAEVDFLDVFQIFRPKQELDALITEVISR